MTLIDICLPRWRYYFNFPQRIVWMMEFYLTCMIHMQQIVPMIRTMLNEGIRRQHRIGTRKRMKMTISFNVDGIYRGIIAKRVTIFHHRSFICCT